MQVEEPVNPGLSNLFPWISQVARNFETYKVNKLSFFFKSTSADSVLGSTGSTALGSVFMAAQYNVLMPPYANKKEMLNGATVKSTKPSRSMHFSVKTTAITKKLFVRADHTDIKSDEVRGDRRLYDLLDFHLATEGCQATTGVIGELYCYADITFTTPTIQDRDPDWALFAINSTGTMPTAPSGLQNQVLDPHRGTSDHSGQIWKPLNPNGLPSSRIEAHTIVQAPAVGQEIQDDEWPLSAAFPGGVVGDQIWTFVPGDEMSNARDHIFMFRLAVGLGITGSITTDLAMVTKDCTPVTFSGTTSFQLPSGFGISHSSATHNSKTFFIRITGNKPKFTFSTAAATLLTTTAASITGSNITFALITNNGADGNWL